MEKTIRTLVVDDSVFMRTVLMNALTNSVRIEVVGSAQNGEEALQKIRELKPDVVTLDIEMPGMDGLEVVRRVMKEQPTPIIMVSTKTQDGARITFEALDLGAVDYVAKPLGDPKSSLQGFQEKVIRAVEAAAQCDRTRLGRLDRTRVIPPRGLVAGTEGIVVAIGISAGGPATLHKLIPLIPKGFPPIVLAQHMPADFTAPFARRLNSVAKIEVCESTGHEELASGHLYLAPGDQHLRVRRVGTKLRTMLDRGPKVSGYRPSVDVLFESVSSACGARAIGLVMTGMGHDGAVGIGMMKDRGAATMAQDRDSSIVWGMPKAAFETGKVDEVVGLSEIPEALVRRLESMAKAGALA